LETGKKLTSKESLVEAEILPASCEDRVSLFAAFANWRPTCSSASFTSTDPSHAECDASGESVCRLSVDLSRSSFSLACGSVSHQWKCEHFEPEYSVLFKHALAQSHETFVRSDEVEAAWAFVDRLRGLAEKLETVGGQLAI
jgi:hypothetical protein